MATKNQKILVNYKEAVNNDVNPYKMSSIEAERVKERNRELISHFNSRSQLD